MSRRYPITVLPFCDGKLLILKKFLLRQIDKEKRRLQKLEQKSDRKKTRSPASSRHPITRIDEEDEGKQ